MFEEYIQELQNKPPEEAKFYSLQMGSDINLSPYLLFEKLNNLDKITSEEIKYLILHYYSIILNKKYIDENKIIIAKAFTNERFITILAQILSSVITLTPEQVICCNRLIYDYMMFTNKDDNIMMILYNLARSINMSTINIIHDLGIPIPMATDMVISRYSTEDDKIAMKRLNLIITNGTLSVINEQVIVNIYEKMFNNLTPMFEGIMFDVWKEEEFNDQEQEEIYGLINLAILDILKDSPSEFIIGVVSSYIQDYYYMYSGSPVRFNLKSIAVYDYQRIIDAVDYVEQTSGLQVPSITT